MHLVNYPVIGTSLRVGMHTFSCKRAWLPHGPSMQDSRRTGKAHFIDELERNCERDSINFFNMLQTTIGLAGGLMIESAHAPL